MVIYTVENMMDISTESMISEESIDSTTKNNIITRLNTALKITTNIQEHLILEDTLTFAQNNPQHEYTQYAISKLTNTVQLEILDNLETLDTNNSNNKIFLLSLALAHDTHTTTCLSPIFEQHKIRALSDSSSTS